MSQSGPYDDLARSLQRLRHASGLPSFGDIAVSVSRVRLERGCTVDQARVGRTTVYDAFRMGRQRIDAVLVGDIARALGADEELADELTARALQPRSGIFAGPAVSDAAPATVVTRVEPEPEVPIEDAQTALTRPTRRIFAAILLAGLVLNMTGWVVTELLDLPVYLDMMGTAFAAIALGPWWGVLVGVTTNAAGTSVSGPESLLFAPVNAAGALVWGYGVRRYGMGRSIPRFFGLSLLVAAVCTAVAVPVIAGPLGGFSQSGVDEITTSVLGITHSMWLSVAVSNLFSSVTDKLIAGFVALTILEAIPASLQGSLVPPAWLSGASE